MAKQKKQKKQGNARILLVGHGECGKDLFAEIIERKYGYRFRGSSQVMCNEPEILERFEQYETGRELFENRRKHRVALYEAICEYNNPDKTRLAKLVCQGGEYGYTGMRDFAEVMACIEAGVFTHIVWIERKGNKPDPTQKFSFENLLDAYSEKSGFALAKVMNYPVKGFIDGATQADVTALADAQISRLMDKRNFKKFLDMKDGFAIIA